MPDLPARAAQALPAGRRERFALDGVQAGVEGLQRVLDLVVQPAIAAGKYIARTQPAGRADLETVVKHMIARGSTVGRADILSVLDDLCSTIELLVQDGYTVTTPVVNVRPTIQGTFEGPLDSFDPARHRLKVCISAGRRLKKGAPADIELVKCYSSKAAPLPQRYSDIRSGTQDEILTPGGTGWLQGQRLVLDPADPLQGVFFVDTASETATRVAEVTKCAGSEILFLVPALPAATYRLEVRASFNSSGDIRTGALEAALTVS